MFYKKIVNILRELDECEPGLFAHSRRVAYLSELSAVRMQLQLEEINYLKCAALFHDIGKLNVERQILSKTIPLEPCEYEAIKKHSLSAIDYIEEYKLPEEITEMVSMHHERVDGKGYPYGIKGEDIPIGAKIISVVDAFDAMVNGRVYKKPISVIEALEEIVINVDKQFDNNVVNIFLELGKKGFLVSSGRISNIPEEKIKEIEKIIVSNIEEFNSFASWKGFLGILSMLIEFERIVDVSPYWDCFN